MNVETDYRIALGVPAVLIVGSVAGYLLLLVAGLDRELAINSAMAGVVVTLAILRGVHQAPIKTWSLEFGGLLAVLVAVIALGLRTISLASEPGPLLLITAIATVAMAHLAHRMRKRVFRIATTLSSSSSDASANEQDP